MAKCVTLTQGICRGCMDNIGGIKRAYIASVDDFNGVDTITADAVTGSITDYTLASGASLAWQPLVPSKNTSNYVETINVSRENGTVYYTGVLSMNFNKMNHEKRHAIRNMARSEMVVIFVDQNDAMWFLGGVKQLSSGFAKDVDNACITGGTSFQTGSAKGDANGAALTFTAEMSQPAIPVAPAASGTLETALAEADASCAE